MTRGPNIVGGDDALAYAIEQRLQANRFRAGQRLPAERQWAQDLQVSRHRIRKALELLERNGSIVRQANSGYFAAMRHPGLGNRSITGKRTLCLLTPYTYNEVPEHPVHLWNREARQRQYVVNLAVYSHDAHDEHEVGEHFIKNELGDAFFWLPSHNAQARSLALLFKQHRTPAVCLQYSILPGGPSSVAVDYWRVGVDAAEQIVRSGRRRVLLLAYAVEHLSVVEMLYGLRQVIGAHGGGIEVQELLLLSPPRRPRDESFIERVRQAMTSFRPDFVFAGSRVMAESALEVLSEQKVQIGQDVLFAGFGARVVAEDRGIDAASYEVDWPAILSEAFGQLDRQVHAGPSDVTVHVKMPVRFVPGRTLGSLPQETGMAGHPRTRALLSQQAAAHM